MRTTSTLVGLSLAIGAAGALLAPTASAADVLQVSDVVVTPVLANAPYAPVADAALLASGLGDPGDCAVTGYEDRAALDGRGVYAAAGCGGARVQLVLQSTAVSGFVAATATATHRYGCVNDRTGRTRTAQSVTTRVVGQKSGYEQSYAPADVATAHGFAAILPAQKVACRRGERAVQTSVSLSNLSVSVTPYAPAGPAHVQQVPGTWSVQLDASALR